MSLKYDDLPEDVRRAIRCVIDYNWQSEIRDASNNMEEGGLDGHIFSELVVLENFASGEDKTAAQHVLEFDGDDSEID